MNVLMLDTLQEVEVDEIEAVRRIRAGVAVEAPMANDQRSTAAPESAMLDRSRNTTTKPVPQPLNSPLIM